MRKGTAFLLVLVAAIAMFAVACGGSEDTGATDDTSGGTASGASEVVVAIGGDPGDLGPFVSMSMGRIGVLNTMYEYLYNGDAPVVAKSNELSEDGLTCTVTLNENVKDSAGNAITAADIAWANTMAIDAAVYRNLGDVDSVEATGDYTVVFKFKNAMNPHTLLDALGECPVISQAAYEASDDQFASMPITTSVYKVTESVPGSSITFEKNADYWQTDESLRAPLAKANVDKIVFQIVEQQAQNSILLETGRIDISANVAGTDISRFENNDDYIVSKFLDNLTQVLIFNGSEGNAFTNKDLRQAVGYAIDADAVGKGAFGENGYFVSHTIGNRNFNGYPEKWDSEEYYTQDTAKAAELFTSSGATSGMTATLLCLSDDATKAMAQVIQSELADLGITVEINAVEQATYNDLKNDPTAWDLALDQSAGGTEVYSPWGLVYDATRYNGATSNFFADPELQSLLEAAIADPSEANLDAFRNYDIEQLYAYGLCSKQNNAVSVSAITKVALDKRNQVIPGACEYSADFGK
ncbi:MAG: ABC transporter substrate-binding protein [Armatimonadetes bacterium]|nr:ABC transporter substrate-binding protein [Armatimonadota bacterium]